MTDNVVNLKKQLDPIEFELQVPTEYLEHLVRRLEARAPNEEIMFHIHVCAPEASMTIITGCAEDITHE